MTAPAHYTTPPHGNRNDLNNIKQFLPYLKAYLWRVMLAMSCLILAKVANVGVPVLLKYIVDHLAKNTAQTMLMVPIILLVGYGLLRLASALFNELRDAVFARVRYGAMRQLSTQLMSHLYRLSLSFHLERETGAVSRDLERGARSASTIMNLLTFNIIPLVVELLLILGVLFMNYAGMFSLITIATVLVYVLFTLSITEWRMQYRLEMNTMDSKANARAVDGLINYETVKYFVNEDYEIKRYNDTLKIWEEAAIKSQTSMSLLNFGQNTVIACGVTLIMIFASYEVTQGHMSLGDFVLVNAFLLQLFIPLNFLGIVYRQMKHSFADMDLFFKLMNHQPEVVDAPQARSLKIQQGAIEFKNVSFSYQKERLILNKINFRVEPGQKLAIVGSSGSGKSTIVRLLFRFYDVSDGQILIDGQDLRELTQQSLRHHIGIVPQDTVLFNESIFHNIAYGNPQATQAQIVAAATMANIHDFILSLPKQYDTVVGERGLKLSGGEKQRVAIARVVLKNPPILVFDEATSALDSHAEQAILDALKNVAQNHTTIAIAHRLSTVVDADQILVLSHGEIMEQGSHRSLLTSKGLYARLWELQQQEQPELSTVSVV